MQNKPFVAFVFIGLALVLLGTHLYVALAPAHSLLNWYPTDDAFFYFKTAQNIASGYGSTFDGIGLTNGYHPLWMLVCIPIFWLANYDLYLPLRLLVLLLGVLNLASAWLLFRWLQTMLSAPVALLGSIFWALYPLIHTQTARNGLETGISAFFLLAVLASAAQKAPRWQTGLLAALAFLSRLDNIFLLSALGLWLALPAGRHRRQVFYWLLGLPLSLVIGYVLRLGIPLFYEYHVTVAASLLLSLAIKLPLLHFASRQRHRLPAFIAGNLAGSAALWLALWVLFRAGVIPMVSRSVLLIDWGVSSALIAVPVLFSPRPAANESPIPIHSAIRSALAYFLPLGGTLIAYLLFNWLVFGTPMPVSGQIKAWWGNFHTIYGRLPDSISAMLWLGSDASNQPFYLLRELTGATASIGMPVIAISLWLFYRQRPQTLEQAMLFPFIIGSLWHIWGYTLRPYAGMRPWYWTGEMLLITLLLALLAEGIYRQMQRHPRGKYLAASLFGLATLWLVLLFIPPIVRQVPYRADYFNHEFFDPIHFLQAETEKGAKIGITGGGYLGYFLTERTVVNLDGLINSPRYATLLQARQADQYLNEIGLQYVYGREKMIMQSQPYQWFLPTHLIPLKQEGKYTLYRYLP